MVRVSCILLLHFAFSGFIVAERLASDYDAWDDSEEHRKLNKSEQNEKLGICGEYSRSRIHGKITVFNCLLKAGFGFQHYDPNDFADNERTDTCHRDMKQTILIKQGSNVNPCFSLRNEGGPVVVLVNDEEMECWTYYSDHQSKKPVPPTKFMQRCFKTALEKPAERVPTDRTFSNYIWIL